jgi:hypothetical protein
MATSLLIIEASVGADDGTADGGRVLMAVSDRGHGLGLLTPLRQASKEPSFTTERTGRHLIHPRASGSAIDMVTK